MALGDVLTKLINERNLSKKEVARQLGYPYTTFISYTNNHREPNIDNLIRMADFFKVPLDSLVGRKKDFHIKPNNNIKLPSHILDFILDKENHHYIEIAQMIKRNLQE